MSADHPEPAATGSPFGGSPHPTLIEQLTADAIASDYAGALVAPQDRPAKGSRERRERILVAGVGLALTGFVMALGLSARITNEPAIVEQRKALRERVDKAEARQAGLANDLVKLRKKVEKARLSSLELSLLGLRLSEEISELEVATGYVAVTGPGMTVTMKDAKDKGDGADPELSRVLDSDIQSAVNGLWQAGAEAIAVNGQRLSARSAIRSAAGAILVNYRPLRPPYVIEAIGDPETLPSRFADTADAKSLKDVSRQFGIGFTTDKAASLQLPAASARLPDTAVVVSGESTGKDGEGKKR